MSNHRTGQHIEGLPVFSTDVVIWDERELPRLQHANSDIAVRMTTTDTHQPFGSANELTAAADDLFQRFATMCGATLINHEWGFAKLPSLPGRYAQSILAQHPVYPTGYTLVAEVQIIRRIFNTMPQSVLQGVLAGHRDALSVGFVGGISIPPAVDVKKEPFRLSDYPHERNYKLAADFAYGKRGPGLTNPNELFLVDIDPYVLSNDPSYELPYTPYTPTQKDYLQFLSNPGF